MSVIILQRIVTLLYGLTTWTEIQREILRETEILREILRETEILKETETQREKTRWELHKNTMCCFEQSLEAAS